MHKFINYLNNHKGAVAIILVLFIVASVPFPAFHSTMLGRCVLIAILVGLAYCNKVLGFIGVIGLVLLYQAGGVGGGRYYWASPYNAEGFSGTVTDASGNVHDISGNLVVPPHSMADGNANAKKTVNFELTGNVNLMDAIKQPAGATTEGFDLLGMEDTMRKGRQSNTINIKKAETSGIPLMPLETARNIESFLII